MKILSVAEAPRWPNSGIDRRLLGTVPQVTRADRGRRHTGSRMQSTSRSRDRGRWRLWTILWKAGCASVDNCVEKLTRRMMCSVLNAVISLPSAVCGGGDRSDSRLDAKRLALCLLCARVKSAYGLACVLSTLGSWDPTVCVMLRAPRPRGGYTRFHMAQVRGVPVLSRSPHSIVNGSRPSRVECVIRTAARGVWLRRLTIALPGPPDIGKSRTRTSASEHSRIRGRASLDLSYTAAAGCCGVLRETWPDRGGGCFT